MEKKRREGMRKTWLEEVERGVHCKADSAGWQK